LPEGERISADKRAKIENDLAKYKLQLSEMGIADYTAMADRRVELEAQAVETIKELATALKDTLVDLTNTILTLEFKILIMKFRLLMIITINKWNWLVMTKGKNHY
jgi:hypothetical protein